MSSDRILARLRELHPRLIDLSLARIERLLAALGNPEERLAPVIHVAGTNGKGSAIAYLRAIMEAAGLRVQVYTSPHLIRFHERIRLGGGLISEDALIDVLDRAEQANAGRPITEFEITTAAAFLAFAEDPADVLLLEVGLGGRLDATNVIKKPELTVITPVSMDHESFLGDTLAAIAGEKAGIIKPEVPLIMGPQEMDALKVILAKAKEARAPVMRAVKDWRVEPIEASEGGGFRYSDEVSEMILPAPALAGPHQLWNAGAAVAAARLYSRVILPDEAIAAGLTQAAWPARMQRLENGPLNKLLPDGAELWLDGGHNPSAGSVVAEVLKSWREADSQRPIVAIVGMLNTKDSKAYLAPLSGLIDRAIGVAVPNEAASRLAEEIRDIAAKAGIAASSAPDLEAALREAGVARAPRVLICGSLYLAGHVLERQGLRVA